jgi:hypothetical protein
MPWSGWAELQSRVKKVVGQRNPFHFGAVEAWCGVFLPVEVEPAELEFSRETPLQVASALELNCELREYARRVRLPTADTQLRARYEKCLDDDELSYAGLLAIDAGSYSVAETQTAVMGREMMTQRRLKHETHACLCIGYNGRCPWFLCRLLNRCSHNYGARAWRHCYRHEPKAAEAP